MARSIRLSVAIATLLVSATALGKPVAPATFCEVYPASPACKGGQVTCNYCHDKSELPATWNAYGTAVKGNLLPGAPRPLSDSDFSKGLPAALAAVEALDSDGDGATNEDEISAGTFPGQSKSVPQVGSCPPEPNGDYDVCRYDPRYVFRKLHVDFCGRSPTFDQVEAFVALPESSKGAALTDALDACMATEMWRGKDGVLWQIAHRKIRPVGSLKAGEDQGLVPIADYYDDYNLFVYTQLDDHDARDVLLADYFVQRTPPAAPGSATKYTRLAELPFVETMQAERRAGLLTTRWNLLYNVMFTALPRTAAAQAYRAFLGFDISKQEGLYPIPGEPVDYDARGVKAEACAACHSTLDPLTYPFKNYDGFQGPAAEYNPLRLEENYSGLSPDILKTPESGYVLGKPVQDLLDWAKVAADSDEFAAATVKDYWKAFIGHPPAPEEAAEFESVWKAFRETDGYSVRKMLHHLILTEAYGVP